MRQVKHGSCVCGAVRYAVEGPLRAVIACHCVECRKQSGHFVAATAAADADLSIEGAEYLTWYAASDRAKRAFCRQCGSALFWKENGSGNTSIMAGSLDGATGLAIDHHIYCAEKGDYYRIDDDLPRYDRERRS